MEAKTGSAIGESASQQFLSFAVGNEEYAIAILRVQEIKCYSAVTPIPNAPAHVKGVMNLRGSIVPVVDLRVRFGVQECTYTPVTVIVLVAVTGKVVGLVVDRVSDVLHIAESSIAPSPDFGGGIDTSLLHGIARVDDRLLGLVDVDVAGSVEIHVPAREHAQVESPTR